MWFTARRRRRITSLPFPAAWHELLSSRWPLYATLPPAQRRELQRTTLVLLDEKYFEGCGGLTLTDEHRVLIAAQAALLLLGREGEYYSGLRSILVYPSAFVGQGKAIGPAGLVTMSRGGRAGESWHTPGVGGPVVLSWRDVLAGAADAGDAQNVVLHEFAHQLDGESDVMEGIPRLESRSQVDHWQRTLAHELHRFNMMIRAGQPTAINPYGSQNPAEYFACATEAFFENPRGLEALHPETFALLRGYFRQDPREWGATLAEQTRLACAACA